MNMQYRLGLATACALALAACGDGGSSSSAAPTTGTLNLKMTDAPVDSASKVVVVFSGVELNRNGETTTVDFAGCPADMTKCKQIDLLTLQGGKTTDLLSNQSLPAGDYQWMRLKVIAERDRNDASYIEFESQGTKYPLWIPSGDEAGLKLNRPFSIPAGGSVGLVVDFDLRKSVHAPPGQAPNYILRPTLRVVGEVSAGKITGTLDVAALATAQSVTPATNCKPAVYLFAGADATPDDQDGSATDGADPVAYTGVLAGTTPTYTFSFVEAGSYTLAATCNGDVDVAGADNYTPPSGTSMKWTRKTGVTATAGQTTTLNLP